MALNFNGVEPTEIKVIKNDTTTNLNVYKYATTGTDLGEATRSAVSTYTKAQLDSYVGLENDTWGGITNASSLVANKYYYIRVLVSDTNKYGKFCVRFKSYSGQTITVDDMGWGYDGEVIYSTPVWGKPFTLSVSNRGTTTTVTRTSSPNEHATQTSLSNGDTVYYGDVLSISVSANSGYGTDWIENRSATSLTSAGTRKWTVTVTNNIDLNFYTYKKVSVTIKKLPTNCFIGFALTGTSTEVIGGTTSRDNTTTVKEGSSLYNIRIGCSKTAYNLDFYVTRRQLGIQ